MIQNIEKIPIEQQKLVFADCELEDSRQLSDFNIADKATINLILLQKGGGEIIYVDDKFRAPQFDFDFRKIDDSGIEFRRGGLVYQRP